MSNRGTNLQYNFHAAPVKAYSAAPRLLQPDNSDTRSSNSSSRPRTLRLKRLVLRPLPDLPPSLSFLEDTGQLGGKKADKRSIEPLEVTRSDLTDRPSKSLSFSNASSSAPRTYSLSTLSPATAFAMFSSVSQITDSVYLSSFHPVRPERLRQLGIELVVNCTVEIPCVRAPGVEAIQLHVDDTPFTNIKTHFDRVSHLVSFTLCFYFSFTYFFHLPTVYSLACA